MNRPFLNLAIAAALVASGLAAAQKKDAPKLYRWVDKQGKVHFDQALPPEAVEQARTEFSMRSGRNIGSIDRALTPEERAAQAAAANAAVLAAAAGNEQKRQEDIMMASYETENDLRRAYGERIGLLQMTVESTTVSIRSLQENLTAVLSQSSDTELDGRRVLDGRDKSIRELHAERMKQQSLQAARRADLTALNAEFARMLGRYRELRNLATAPASAVAPPPAAPAGG